MTLKENFFLSLICNLVLVSLLLMVGIGQTSYVKADDSLNDVLEDSEDIPVVEGEGPDIVLPEEDGVLVLNSKNFDYIVSTRDPVLIEFYAPWCGHCKSLTPHYAAAAKELKKEGITIAKVDATIESEIAARFQVTGYPTIKLFRKGEPAEDFDGERTTSGIIEYMKQKADPNYKPPPSSVIDLTDDTFHTTVDESPIILVEFFAPWCGHCKKLAPEYEKAARDLLLDNVPLAKVDSTENPELTKEFGITGYPTLKVFRKGRPFEYKGGRDHSTIVSYMKEQVALPSVELMDSSSTKKHVLKTQITIFGHFSSDTSTLYNEYIAAANLMRGQFNFVHTFSKDVAGVHNIPQSSIGVIMPKIYSNKFEEDLKLMKESEEDTAASITSWIKTNSLPLLGERTKSNVETLYSKRPLLVVYGEIDFSHAHIKATQFLRNKILPLATKFRDRITFALSNEENFEDEMQTIGLGDSGENVNAAIFTDKHKYRMEPDDDYEEEIEEFLSKFEAGKLTPYLKSQAVPKRQKGPVTVLVAHNFDDHVLSGNSDYLIEFYAPWCGHCKKLEPIYKQLATEMVKENSGVVVAKFEATANDIPVNFDVKGFPTIYFVKKDNLASPIQFEGNDRSLAALKEFIDENRTGSPKEEL